jgi:hypothetical protein
MAANNRLKPTLLLKDSVHYVVNLPLTAVGYRQTSLLTMVPAYQTMLLAAHKLSTLFTPDHHVKISRHTMAQSVVQTIRLATDNEAIQKYAQRMQQRVTEALDQPITSFYWFGMGSG